MVTTIQVSDSLKRELTNRKLNDNETYEEIIWDMLEDEKELSEETKKNILESEKDIKEGRVKTLKQIKLELGL